MEQEIEAVEDKKRRRLNMEESLKSKLENAEASVESTEKRLARWKRVLAYITSLETHGSKKDPQSPWSEYCKKAFAEDEAEDDWPAVMTSAEVPFAEILLHISGIVANTAATLTKEQAWHEKVKLKTQKRATVESNREHREKVLLEKALDHSNTIEQEKKLGLESKLVGAWCLVFLIFTPFYDAV